MQQNYHVALQNPLRKRAWESNNLVRSACVKNYKCMCAIAEYIEQTCVRDTAEMLYALIPIIWIWAKAIDFQILGYFMAWPFGLRILIWTFFHIRIACFSMYLSKYCDRKILQFLRKRCKRKIWVALGRLVFKWDDMLLNFGSIRFPTWLHFNHNSMAWG